MILLVLLNFKPKSFQFLRQTVLEHPVLLPFFLHCPSCSLSIVFFLCSFLLFSLYLSSLKTSFSSCSSSAVLTLAASSCWCCVPGVPRALSTSSADWNSSAEYFLTVTEWDNYPTHAFQHPQGCAKPCCLDCWK